MENIKYLDKVIDHLVRGTKIIGIGYTKIIITSYLNDPTNFNTLYKDVFSGDILPYYSPVNSHLIYFSDYVIKQFGLDGYEIEYVWKGYLKKLKDKIDNKNSLNEFYTPENDNFNIDTLNFIDTEKKLCNYLVDRFFNGIELEFPEDRMYGKYINFKIKELGFSVWVEKSPLKKSLYMKFNRDFHSELLGLIMDYLKKYLGLTALESSKYAITITYLLFKKIYEELFMTNKI